MNDEIIETLEPVPALEPEPISVPESDPTPEPDPTPVLEVISVDELLNRLSQGDESSGDDELSEPVEGDPGEALADVPVADPDPVVVIVEQVAGQLIDMIADLGKIEAHTQEIADDTDIIKVETVLIAQTLNHPALTTSFAEYTVTEALLLLLLLSAFISACARMLRGGLSWLRS